MAQRVQIPFVGQQSTSRSILVNNQQTVNFMNAVKGSGAKAPVVLESAPGLVVVDSTVGDGPLRSPTMLPSRVRPASTQAELYGVYGSKLMAQTSDQGNIEIGTLGTSAFATKVRIARGRSHILIVDGSEGYTYDGTTFAAIADLDFPANPTHCVYIDGFFVVNDATTDNFYISASEDPTSWNALDFEAAAVAPDAALALAATESILWIIGDETAQGFYNDGNPDFPYAIILNATQEVGILAPQSIAESDAGIFYLATTPEGGRFVYQIGGTEGRTISGDEQEDMLETVGDPTTAYGFIYKQSGKSFYVLQLGATTGDDPRDSVTLLYNIKAGTWETREINDGSAWRAAGHGILDNDNIVGSRLQAQNLRLDLNNFQDSGQEMIRRRRAQVIHNNNKTLTFWSLIVEVEGGIGTDLSPNPILKMRYSNDGGRTFGSWLEESLGAIGETLTRVKFDKLGSSRNRVFEIECSDAVELVVIAAYAEITIEND
ncbi:MAG: hypothetical protein ACR2PR_08005 [Pseudohongiellaceae bacterium]